MFTPKLDNPLHIASIQNFHPGTSSLKKPTGSFKNAIVFVEGDGNYLDHLPSKYYRKPILKVTSILKKLHPAYCHKLPVLQPQAMPETTSPKHNIRWASPISEAQGVPALDLINPHPNAVAGPSQLTTQAVTPLPHLNTITNDSKTSTDTGNLPFYNSHSNVFHESMNEINKSPLPAANPKHPPRSKYIIAFTPLKPLIVGYDQDAILRFNLRHLPQAKGAQPTHYLPSYNPNIISLGCSKYAQEIAESMCILPVQLGAGKPVDPVTSEGDELDRGVSNNPDEKMPTGINYVAGMMKGLNVSTTAYRNSAVHSSNGSIVVRRHDSSVTFACPEIPDTSASQQKLRETTGSHKTLSPAVDYAPLLTAASHIINATPEQITYRKNGTPNAGIHRENWSKGNDEGDEEDRGSGTTAAEQHNSKAILGTEDRGYQKAFSPSHDANTGSGIQSHGIITDISASYGELSSAVRMPNGDHETQPDPKGKRKATSETDDMDSDDSGALFTERHDDDRTMRKVGHNITDSEDSGSTSQGPNTVHRFKRKRHVHHVDTDDDENHVHRHDPRPVKRRKPTLDRVILMAWSNRLNALYYLHEQEKVTDKTRVELDELLDRIHVEAGNASLTIELLAAAQLAGAVRKFAHRTRYGGEAKRKATEILAVWAVRFYGKGL